MAQAKKTTTAKKKPAAKAKKVLAKPKAKAKAKAAKKAPKAKVKAKAVAPKKAKAVDLETLDRKALAARARQLKVELMGIRFNLQAPSLKEYRLKRKELSAVLGQLK